LEVYDGVDELDFFVFLAQGLDDAGKEIHLHALRIAGNGDEAGSAILQE
jgi:hypothetical protein